jgi:hypothetical protein
MAEQSVKEKVEEIFAPALDDTVERAAQEAPLAETPAEEVVEEPGIEVDESVLDEPPPDTDGPDPVVEGEDAAELFEIQLDSGTVYEVPEELKDAFVKQKDYTEKTQQVAQTRKELELKAETVAQQEERYKFTEAVQDDLTNIQMLDWQIGQIRNYMRENVGSLPSSEIDKYRFQVEDLEVQKNAISDAVRVKYDEFQQAAEQARSGLRDKSTEILKGKIPSWDDNAEKQTQEYALSIGFTEQELQNATDPREWEVLWKAAQYDRLQAGKATAVKKVGGAPEIRPKARNPMPKETQDKLNLRKKLKSDKLSPRQKQKLVAEDLGKRWAT